VYFNYGGDYIARDWALSGTTQVGYGNYSADMSGCGIEPVSTAATRPPTRSPRATPPTDAKATTRTCRSSRRLLVEYHRRSQGPLRQGIQYSLIRRDLWSVRQVRYGNQPGGGAHGDDNMIFTSFRYYLP
jgi:hypothetical protein